MKVVINRCFGGFGLSQDAYRWLIDRGVPVVPHHAQKRDPETGLYLPEPRNEGDVIIDYEHPDSTWGDSRIDKTSLVRMIGCLSDAGGWLRRDRANPLLVGVVEALGAKANGAHAKLAIVEIPDGVDYEIDDYDGSERVHEKHRSWP